MNTPALKAWLTQAAPSEALTCWASGDGDLRQAHGFLAALVADRPPTDTSPEGERWWAALLEALTHQVSLTSAASQQWEMHPILRLLGRAQSPHCVDALTRFHAHEGVEAFYQSAAGQVVWYHLRVPEGTLDEQMDPIVAVLLSHAPPVDHRPVHLPWTALSQAVEQDCPPVVRALLRLGADPRGARGGAFSPLNRAIDRQSLEMVDALMHAGADVHALDADGYRPLDLALWRRRPTAIYVDIVQRLLAAGADPHATVEDGKGLSSWARFQNSPAGDPLGQAFQTQMAAALHAHDFGERLTQAINAAASPMTRTRVRL